MYCIHNMTNVTIGTLCRARINENSLTTSLKTKLLLHLGLIIIQYILDCGLCLRDFCYVYLNLFITCKKIIIIKLKIWYRTVRI